MNLLFVSNGSLTPVYSAVAKHLESLGNKIFWVVTEHNWQNYLCKDFNSSSILYVKKDIKLESPKTLNISIPLNEIILIDRELKSWGNEYSSLYISNLHHKIKDFLLSNQIKIAFSENSWAHEIIISMLCDFDNEINCLHFSPHNVRIPDNRFALFSNFLLYKTISRKKSSDKISPNFYKSNSEIKKQDDIISKRRNSKIAWLRKLYSFVFHPDFDNNSPTWWGSDRKHSFERVMKQLLNSFTYKFVNKIGREEISRLAQDTQLYIYALHKEPETSVNNKGRYYESQAQCIINIWRKLPVGTVLLIKEHRVSIGDRGYFYFKKLCRSLQRAMI